MEPNFRGNTLTIPVAIIVAGGLIAVAIFLKGNGNLVSVTQAKQPMADKEQALVPPPEGIIHISPVDAERDHIRGNPDASIVIVEFSDPECPFCKRFHFTMQQLMNLYGKSGKVAWVYREFPIVQLHSKAPKEAEALECAAELGGNQKFWEYTDLIFTRTTSNDSLDPAELPRIASDIGLKEEEFMNCLSSGRQAERVQADITDGTSAGVNGTPHSILVLKSPIGKGARSSILALMEPYRDQSGDLPVSFSSDGLRVSINGALPFDIMKKIIDALLK